MNVALCYSFFVLSEKSENGSLRERVTATTEFVLKNSGISPVIVQSNKYYRIRSLLLPQ